MGEYKMGKKKTIEKFKQEVKELGNDEYEVLNDEYFGNKVHLEFLHKTCGFKFMSKPNTFTSGSRCPLCSGKIRKDINYFKDEVKNLVGDEYEVVGEYINTHTKTMFKHNCGNTFEMSPHNFISGQRCKFCQHRSYVKTTEEFKNEVKELIDDEYSVLGEYKNNKTKILFRHNKCGKEYMVTPSDFLCGYRCSYCFGNQKLTQEEFINRVNKSIGNDYIVKGKYINSKSKVEIKHLSCNNTWMANPMDVLFNHSGCPKCKISKGEREIEKLLNVNNIRFISQYKFSDCKNIYLLPFDFYLPDYNVCIEYDGQLHYMSVDYFGGDKSLEKTKTRDKIKTSYCKDNDIKLIRIPYWNFNSIEEIIKQELKLI